MSPEVMVGALAGLTELRDLCILFSTGLLPTNLFHDTDEGQSLDSPSLDRVIFPALIKFQLGGDSEYLEDLVALIDAPRLENLSIGYYAKYYDDFDTEGNIEASNLSQFIGRTPTFKHAQFRHANVTLNPHTTSVAFGHPRGECQQARVSLNVWDGKSGEEYLETPLLATALNAIHILTQLAITLSDVQLLSIGGIVYYERQNRFHLGFERYTEGDRILESGVLSVVWFQLLRSFPAVNVLHVSWRLAGSIALAINRLPESMATQVLPALQTLLLDDLDKIRKHEPRASTKQLLVYTEQFLHCRKQSGRPVVIVNSHDQFIRGNPH